ncbi:MAG: hypothetical protein AAGN66_25500 [Acidobacteriota bacterium]
MLRSTLFHLLLAVAVAGTAVAEAAPSASSEFGTLLMDLEHVDSGDAMTVVRAIVGAKAVEAVGERGLKVTESSENLATARTVLELIDVEPGQEPAEETAHIESDQTVIARSILRSPIHREVMTALREQIRPQHVAIVQDPPLVILRDSPEKVRTSRALIASMQRTEESSD